MLFMFGPESEYWRRSIRCVCGHQCSFEIDVCPSCEHNLRLLCECDTCDERFWYEGQERCPNCGATLPDYESKIPKIEMVIAKHYIGLTFMTVDTPNVFCRHHALLPAKDPRVRASVQSFGIPENENIYMVVIAQRLLTNNCKGFAICEHGIYCRDIKEWHGLIRWGEFANQRSMPVKSSLGILRIGSHEFNIVKHSDCSCSDLKDYLDDLQYHIIEDNIEWFDEDEEESLYQEEDSLPHEENSTNHGTSQPSLNSSSSGNSRIVHILKTIVARHAFSDIGIICQSGLPINNDKADKARVSFGIPDTDDIYFIASGQMMGGVSETSKGFAITTSGICYRSSGRKQGFYDWELFSNVKVSANTFTYIKIGAVEFQITGQGKVLKLLLDLQSEIRNNLSAIIAELQSAAQQKAQLEEEQLKKQKDIEFIKNYVRSKLMENYGMAAQKVAEIEYIICMFSNLKGMDAKSIVCFFKEKNIEFASASADAVASYIEKSSPQKVAEWVLMQTVVIFQIEKKSENNKAIPGQQSLPEKKEGPDSAKKSPPQNAEEVEENTPEKICPSCKERNKSTARFCNYCGTSLEETRFCVQCGTKLRPGKKFCSGCGAKIE